MSVLLEAKDLVKYFPVKTGVFSKPKWVHAVDKVTLQIKKEETLGLVGESGCGKTTFGRTILRLIEPTAGQVYFEGRNLLKLSESDMRGTRRDMQIVFQDPFSSLDPRVTVKNLVGEPLTIHGLAKGDELKRRVLSLLERVGLSSFHMYRYPHEFSGGQRQRIVIARAISLNPKFIVLDEPTSSLDVSVQAKILNLLKDLQRDMGITYLFISHHLSVVKYMSDRIAVMYLGKIVELATTEDLFRKPLHPYTQALLPAIPVPDPDVKWREEDILKGEVPSPIDLPSGCRFHMRCAYAKPKCEEKEPELVDVGGEHTVACHFWESF